MRLMLRHLALTIFVFYFASPVHRAASLEWIVEDAVYITPDADDESEIETRSPSEPVTTLNTGNQTGGECIKMRECYPILFLTDRKEPDYPATSINSDLVDFILETADFCQPKMGTNVTKENTDPGDVFIWCHLRAIAKKRGPTYRPVIIETKAEREDGVCGQTSKIIQSSGFDYGQGEPGERVVGGKELVHGDAPYIVVMKFKGKQVCGGSVLDEYHVLRLVSLNNLCNFITTVSEQSLKASVLHHLRFFIGDHNIKDPTDVHHQERNVSKIIYHKEFSADTLHDDIAMIKLSEPIQYTSKVGPVCISDGTQPFDDGNTNGKLVGWGQLEEGGDRPLTPRVANLRIWKTEDCEDVYEDIVPEDIMEKAFCAGGFQDGGETDACKGDSGGPLTLTRNDRIEQIGIVSFGIGCGRYPGVFTKVSEYIGWIDRHRSRYVS